MPEVALAVELRSRTHVDPEPRAVSSEPSDPGDESGPVTPKGRRTRTKLIAAASEVFAERQYLDTNVADIVARAGVSHGTFYTYFRSKEEIFKEVAVGLQEVMLATREQAPREAGLSLFDRVERTNRAYLQAYQDHAALFAVVEQVASFNPEFRSIRREIRNGFVERSERSIARMQRDGIVHDDVDPRYAANALGSMVDRFAYVYLVLGEDFDFDESVRTLTLLWARALGIEAPHGVLGMPKRRAARRRQRPT